MTSCPCGSDTSFERCCGRYIKDGEQPTTAEQLMRARYTAHTCDEMGFVKATHHPDTVAEFDEATARSWAKESKWLGLEILAVDAGQETDESGTVEFRARYENADGVAQEHHEISDFGKVDGVWKFRDGSAPINREPYRRTDARVGRNDPCPCGSGKKFKKCCG